MDTPAAGVGAGAGRAGRQVGFLFLFCGAAGLLNLAIPGPVPLDRERLTVVAGALLTAGAGLVALPWGRWRRSASLWLVPPVLGLLSVSERFGHATPTAYGALFVVAFVWVGAWHPPRTALYLAPAAAAAYVVPLATAMHPNPALLRSTVVVIPACVLVGEMLAATTQRVRQAQTAQQETAAALAIVNITDELTGVGNRRQGNALVSSL